MKPFAWLGHALVVILLTVLTQVGGAIYLLALVVRARLPVPTSRPLVSLAALFISLYALTWFPIQAAAALAGRIGLPCLERGALRVASPIYCITHRHYVSREMRALGGNLAQSVEEAYPGTLTQTLDANFPFFDGFPMLPHLSHDDGEKLDVAFYYARVGDGEYARGALRSPIGYWAFEPPQVGDRQPCRGRSSTLRWDQYWFQPFTRDDLALDGRRLTAALRWLERDGHARHAFLEPHLVDRLDLDAAFVRFQGCNAARHDDHFHVELR